MGYDEQISLKHSTIKALFELYFKGEIEIFKSQIEHYRTRAEFGLWHEGDELFWTMHSADKNAQNPRVFVDTCPKVDNKIIELMARLKGELLANEKLKFKVFGAEFIATEYDTMAILLYHRNVDEIFDELEALQKRLGIKLIARSRGKKLVFGGESLRECLKIGGKEYIYSFGDNAFIQPNTRMNEKMIEWARDKIEAPKDLFELYCGHGNFTIPLSAKFRRVLANEISKSSINYALKNCENNGINNINFVRMASEEIIKAFGGQNFHRLEKLDLSEFDISHILVDPPRAGLDDSVIDFITGYENIIYISCNPTTASKNLAKICQTHEVKNLAIFDQFPHTMHAECGIMLRKIK